MRHQTYKSFNYIKRVHPVPAIRYREGDGYQCHWKHAPGCRVCSEAPFGPKSPRGRMVPTMSDTLHSADADAETFTTAEDTIVSSDGNREEADGGVAAWGENSDFPGGMPDIDACSSRTRTASSSITRASNTGSRWSMGRSFQQVRPTTAPWHHVYTVEGDGDWQSKAYKRADARRLLEVNPSCVF